MFWGMWAVMNKTMRRRSQVRLSHNKKSSVRRSRSSLTYGIRAKDDSFLRWGIVTNAPIVFMNLMNQVFRPYLDQYMVVFIDDILVYSNSYLEHEQHLRVVLQTLRENRLYTKLNNCEFWLKELVFLDHVIVAKWIFVDPRKVEVVVKWERPTNMTEIQNFLGLVGYYMRFIEGFSTIAHLIKLTHKEVRFVWSKEYKESFRELKERLTASPILVLPLGIERFVV